MEAIEKVVRCLGNEASVTEADRGFIAPVREGSREFYERVRERKKDKGRMENSVMNRDSTRRALRARPTHFALTTNRHHVYLYSTSSQILLTAIPLLPKPGLVGLE